MTPMYVEPHTVLRRWLLEQLRARLEAGEAGVVGMVEAVPPGGSIGRVGDRRLTVKRRSTREQFLLNGPPGADLSEVPKAPFYYELELTR